ncbi:MAG: type I 3-dehydroquinate dehydratase [Candidatus Thermoplasmatota archaeon]|nr:type I 3-dehydroquinate dehydratase [Candidatus Thermoplasmatota archaeon]
MIRPLVCVTLEGRTAEELSDDAKTAKELGADVVEVRLDLLWTKEEKVQASGESNTDESSQGNGFEFQITQLELDEVDFESALKTISICTDLPMIMTCRPTEHGGFYPGTEEERFQILRSAISCEPSWIDLEVDITGQIREELVQLAGDGTKVIASTHNIDNTPSPSEIAQDIQDSQDLGEIVKACYGTRNRADGLRIFEAAWDLKDSGINTALMGLGPGGDWVRIHAPLLGQYMVYSTTESGWHLSQQGRINASDLKMAWSILEYS